MKGLILALMLTSLACSKKGDAPAETQEAAKTAKTDKTAVDKTDKVVADKTDAATKTEPPKPIKNPPEPPPAPPTTVGDFAPGATLTATHEMSPENEPTFRIDAEQKADKVLLRVTAAKKTTKLEACKAEHKLRVEAIYDPPQLHILCLKMGDDGEPKWTIASRYEWNRKKKTFKPSGGFEGEGRVDYQTIDLDEE